MECDTADPSKIHFAFPDQLDCSMLLVYMIPRCKYSMHELCENGLGKAASETTMTPSQQHTAAKPTPPKTPKMPPHSSNLPHLELSHLPHMPIPSLNDTFKRYLDAVKPLFQDEEISIESNRDGGTIAPPAGKEHQKAAAPSRKKKSTVSYSSQHFELSAGDLEGTTDQKSPLSNAAQFQHTQGLVSEFVQSEEAISLDAELRQIPASHFLEGFWNSSYLEQVDPIIINTNPYFRLREDPNRLNQCLRAANLLLGTAQFAQTIINNDMKDYMKYEMSRDPSTGKLVRTEMCLTQYHWILSSRIAQPSRDYLKSTLKSTHAVVLCRYQFYKIQLYEADGSLRSENDLYNELLAIMKDAQQSQKHEVLPVGSLTTTRRDTWAEARAHLANDRQNRASLSTIDNALILIILDESAPTDWDDIARLGMHSDGRNVWMDKSLSVTVCRNAETAINMEHAGYDGTTFNAWARFVGEYAQQQGPPRDVEEYPSSRMVHVQKLNWNISKRDRKAIKNAEKAVDSLISRVDLSILRFKLFGKREIKRLKTSPDAFVQMAYQLCYFRLFRKTVSTYEAMNVKKYFHGRTSTVRVQSEAARRFTLCFTDPLTSVHDKAESLRHACRVHQENTRRAKIGQGVDRHLFGLHSLARHRVQKLPYYEIPAVFRDAAYKKFKTDLMSTSNSSGVESLVLQGFGPVCPEGFGLGYIYSDDEITLSVSNFKNKSQMFRDALRQTMIDMYRVLNVDMQENGRKNKSKM